MFQTTNDFARNYAKINTYSNRYMNLNYIIHQTHRFNNNKVIAEKNRNKREYVVDSR